MLIIKNLIKVSVLEGRLGGSRGALLARSSLGQLMEMT